MKLSSFIALGLAGCAGFTAYQAYQKREEIKDDIADATTSVTKLPVILQKSAKRLIISTNNYQNLKALAKNWTTNVAYLNKKAKADLNKSKRHFQNTKN